MGSGTRDSIEIDSTTFYHDAQRYDLSTGALSGIGPVEFFRTRVMRYGGPVLELAYGTGRLAIAIAQHDVEVAGLDTSPQMLIAERKASASDLTIMWIRDDMRNFDRGRRFQFILVASNSVFAPVLAGGYRSMFGLRPATSVRFRLLRD